MPKLLRITTVPISLNILLKGQLKYMQENGFEVVTASATGSEVEEVIEREGVKHYALPFTRVISPFRDLICLIQTIHLIKRIKPDIIHTHTPKAGLLGMMAGWCVGVPHRLHTVAGMPLMEANGLTKIVLRWAENLTYKCATQVYPNSSKLEKWIYNNLVTNKKKLKVIGSGSSNGIDTQYFNLSIELKDEGSKVRNKLNIKKEELVYVFVGRLVSDKGISELIEAFALIKTQHSHLLLVGNYENLRGPVGDEIKKHIETNKQIHTVGFQSDIRPYLAAADVFVFPSYREGFPNVVLQAGAMSLPAVVSDINGCNEIIIHEKNGMLVPPKEPKPLAEAMKKLGSDAKLRSNMANEARLNVLKFDQKVYWQLLLKEYRSLINSNV